MFGTYRALLALMVVFQHLGEIRGLGAFAVFGFYVLSGYLMTLILHASYGYSPAGIGRYALNRFLRIYPIYWIACLTSIALVLWLGADRTSTYQASIRLPDDLESALRNLLIVIEYDTKARLTPPAWALTAELFYYACIGLGMSRTRFRTIVWFAASTLYTVYVNLAQLPWTYHYHLIPAASLPFSTGALIYHYKDRVLEAVPLLRARLAPVPLFALILLNFAASQGLGTLRTWGFYLNYALNTLIVLSLAGRSSLPGISRRVDESLGDFSYPIYLMHYQAGLLLVGLGVGWRRGELSFALVSLPLIFGFAWLLTTVVERPIERLRRRVKKSGGYGTS